MRRGLVLAAAAAILLVSPAAALSFDVSIGAIADMDASFVQYADSPKVVQEVNATVLNSGSVGCVYRMKGEFRYGNVTHTRYSQPYPLIPTESATVELQFIPENYTGEVEASLYSMYCDQQEFVENITFTSERVNIANDSVDSRTLSSSDERAEIQLEEVDSGLLVPRQAPPYWKASSSRIRNGSATLQYAPPIYVESEKLNYTVVRNGSIAGYTTVSLEVEPTAWDRIRENLVKILAILLGFSVLLNARLLRDRLLRK